MKEYLRTLVRESPDPQLGINQVREYLQARILGSLQRSGAMIPLSFHGGTALRFLYAIPRYSEDLDFALERNTEQFNLRRYLDAIKIELGAENYQLEIRMNDSKVVQNAWIRFNNLLYELDLSPHRNTVLAVKLEVDTRPPAGAQLATTVIRRHVILQLHHHDKASLLAGKLHAILQRPYLKGRDVFDLLWYASDPDWPEPNLTWLNNTLAQTGWESPILTCENWRSLVLTKLDGADWRRIVEDVQPFLEPSFNISLLNQENLESVLLT